MKKVAIIDSGSGGCNILAECLKVCPCFDYFLFIDDKNLPYGGKSKKELQRIACENVGFLEKVFSPDIVVVACNTLTAVSLEILKKKFCHVFFVGVEPNLCEVKKRFLEDEILVLATPVTAKYNKDLKSFCSTKICEKNLPKFIDENLFDREKILQELKQVLPQKSCKAIVLGCTHYEGIKNELVKIYGEVEFFSRGEDVARQLKSFAEGEGFNLQIKTSSGKNIGYFFEYVRSLIC